MSLAIDLYPSVLLTFLTVRLGLVSLYQEPLQARLTKEKHETVKRLN